MNKQLKAIENLDIQEKKKQIINTNPLQFYNDNVVFLDQIYFENLERFKLRQTLIMG